MIIIQIQILMSTIRIGLAEIRIEADLSFLFSLFFRGSIWPRPDWLFFFFYFFQGRPRSRSTSMKSERKRSIRSFTSNHHTTTLSISPLLHLPSPSRLSPPVNHYKKREYSQRHRSGPTCVGGWSELSTFPPHYFSQSWSSQPARAQ